MSSCFPSFCPQATSLQSIPESFPPLSSCALYCSKALQRPPPFPPHTHSMLCHVLRLCFQSQPLVCDHSQFPPRTFVIWIEGDRFRCIPSLFLLSQVALDGNARERPPVVQCHGVSYSSVRTQRTGGGGKEVGEPAHASVINASCIATSRKRILLYVPCEEQGTK